MRMGWLCIAALAGGVGVTAGAPAQAGENVCAARAKVIAHLSRDYREVPVALGHANNGGLIEVLRARDGATFTIVITMPDGIACMIAAGSDWRELPVLAQDARF